MNRADLTPPPGGDGWSEWGNHVLVELVRLSGAYEGLRGEVVRIHVEVATLKVKSGIWGAIGALIPITITLGVALIIWYVKGHK